jgi:hypothetical protein
LARLQRVRGSFGGASHRPDACAHLRRDLTPRKTASAKLNDFVSRQHHARAADELAAPRSLRR